MSRKFVFILIIVIFFAVLTGNLFKLQISSQVIYHRKSDANSIREEIVQPVRGTIYDCKGFTLVGNRPAYSLQIVPNEVKDKKAIQDFLLHKLGVSEATLKKRLGKKWWGYKPVKITTVKFDQISMIEEHKLDLPGITYTAESGRYYPDGVKISHALGFIKEINEDEINDKGEYYLPGDIIGKKGLERKYEEKLRGVKSRRYLEVDVHGRVIGEVNEKETKPAITGNNVHLTINLKLQQLIEERMNGLKGAAVVLNPQNGNVLAIVSKPDYDPNYIGWNFSNKEWVNLNTNPDALLFNRSITGTYPPGSTLKIVTAIAAINEKIIKPEHTYNCKGSYYLGRVFRCWNKGGHGTLNMYDAIAQSCNVYFYKLSHLKIGLEKWIYYMEHFRFGRKTGIDLVEERTGFLPDKEYFQKKYNSMKIADGNILNLAIGQGETLVTPLQMAMFAAIIGTRGIYAKPHLLDYFENPETGKIEKYESKIEEIMDISMNAFDVVRKGMLMVTESPKGTAKSARIPNFKVAGKTGTAQNPGEDHAWFIGFAPYENPTIALAVVVENGGGGGAVAAPIAKIAFNYLLNEDEPAEFLTRSR